jgi:hypothetical protein
MEGTKPYKSISKSYLAVPQLPEPEHLASAIAGLHEGTTSIYVEGDVIDRDLPPILAIKTNRVHTLEEQQQERERLRRIELP